MAVTQAFDDMGIMLEPNKTLEIDYVRLLSEGYDDFHMHISKYKKGKYRVRYDKWYGEFIIK